MADGDAPTEPRVPAANHAARPATYANPLQSASAPPAPAQRAPAAGAAGCPCVCTYTAAGDLCPLPLTRLACRVDVTSDVAFVSVRVTARTPAEGAFGGDGVVVVPLGHAEATVCEANVHCQNRVLATAVVSNDDAASLGRGARSWWMPWTRHALSGGGEDSASAPFAPGNFVLPLSKLPAGAAVDVTVRWVQPVEDAVEQDGDGARATGDIHVPLRAASLGGAIVKESRVSKFVLAVVVHQAKASAAPPQLVGLDAFGMIREELRDSGGVRWRTDASAKVPWPTDADVRFRVVFPPAPLVESPHAHLGLRAQLLTQAAPEVSANAAFHFALSASRSAPVFRRSVVFVVDKSGSMRGEPIEHATDALFESLGRLTVGVDSFNVVAFDHEQHVFDLSGCVLATWDSIGACRSWAHRVLRARGLTDILTPLRIALRLLDLHTESERSKDKEAAAEGAQPKAPPLARVVLVTDGKVVDEHTVVAYARAVASSVHISTCGIGAAANHYFLKQLAEQSRGTCTLCLLREHVRSDVSRLMARAAAPAALTSAQIELTFPRKGGGLERKTLDALEAYPSVIPDVPAGGTADVFVSTADGSLPVSATLRAMAADGTAVDVPLPVTALPPAHAHGGENASPPLALVFAKRRLDALVARGWLAQGTPVECRESTLTAKAAAAKQRAEEGREAEDSTIDALVVGTPVPPAYVAGDPVAAEAHKANAHAVSLAWGIPAAGVASLVSFEAVPERWAQHQRHQAMADHADAPPQTLATRRAPRVDPRTVALRGAAGCLAVGCAAVGFGSLAMTLGGESPFGFMDVGGVLDNIAAGDGDVGGCCDCECEGNACDELDCADCFV